MKRGKEQQEQEQGYRQRYRQVLNLKCVPAEGTVVVVVVIVAGSRGKVRHKNLLLT